MDSPHESEGSEMATNQNQATRSEEKLFRVTGTKAGKLQTVTIAAKDHNAAVLKASKGKGLLLVVRDCVLVSA